MNNTGKFSEPVAKHYFRQLIGALYYMHTVANVAHRDVKLENILMDSNYNIKLNDFGFSTKFSNE